MRVVETKVSSVDELVVSENDIVDADLEEEREEEREREREEIKEKRELEWQEAYSGTLIIYFMIQLLTLVISGNLQGPRKKPNLPNSVPVVDLEDVIIGEDLRIAMLKVCYVCYQTCTVDTPYKNVLGDRRKIFLYSINSRIFLYGINSRIFLYGINSRIFLYGINFTLVLRFVD